LALAVIVVQPKNPWAMLGYDMAHETEITLFITGIVYISLPTPRHKTHCLSVRGIINLVHKNFRNKIKRINTSPV
jgi:hypothetical protein